MVGPDLDPRCAIWRQPSGETPVFACRHGPLELAGEAVHVDLIPKLAAQHAAFAPPAERLEAGPLVSLDACRVELEDRQHNVVEAEGGKGEGEHQARRLGAISLAPALRLADQDAEGGRAVAEVHAVQPGIADGPQ